MVPLTFDGLKSRKRERIRDLQKSKRDPSVISSYFENSEKELICNEISKQFVERHRHLNHEYFLVVKNEYNVPRCVCSTLKPELLPYPKIHDVVECSLFFANFFDYEPLENESRVPEFLPSPSQVIAWRTGDCFDLAVALTSFLLGSYYDAYVVYGEGPEWVCKRDLTGRCGKIKELIQLNDFEESEATCAITSVLGENETKIFLNSELERKLMAKKTIDANDDENQSTSGVHCWVLIRSNERCPLSRSGEFFIEPTTGTLYSLNKWNPYRKIFAIWNQMNYWINLNSSNCSKFDFTSSNDWKPVFYNCACGENVRSKDDRLPFDPPLSWVQKLNLPSDLDNSKYPTNGSRTYIMRNMKVELYSNFTHKQNLLIRVSKFKDKEQLQLSCCSERYGQQRSDGLLLRIRLLQEHCLYEKFAQENKYTIDTWTESTGKRRRIVFHSKSRLDNLMAYDETFGQRIVHEYDGRRDRLSRRIVHISWIDEYKEKVKDKLILASSDSTKNVVVLKIEEEFDHFDKIVDDDAICSRVFSLREKKLELRKYHGNEVVEISAECSNGSEADMFNYKLLMESEKIITNSVRSLHLEYVDILRARRRDEDPSISSVVKPKRGYDTETDINKTSAVNESNSETETFDYLTPFLIMVKDKENISKEEAIKVHNSCLEFTKARLLERADIMQLRLDEERKRLTGYQKPHNDSILDEKSKQTDELERIRRDSTFKINILEKRLKQHEDACISKLQSMEHKLRHDPRLSIMFSE